MGRARVVSSGRCALEMTVQHTDATRQRPTARFLKRTHDWVQRTIPFTAEKDHFMVEVFLRYVRQGGRAWFEDVVLLRE